jgi:hypothetical protein
MTAGTDLITKERQRQIEVEGWTAAHDAQHGEMVLANAAACYIFASSSDLIERFWPKAWGWRWWKPKDRLSNLVRAGALIAAEIDRTIAQAAAKG